MKLFRISQDSNNDYDTYDSAVVAASGEEEARNMHPRDGKQIHPDEWGKDFGTWCRAPHQVNVEYLGEAAEGILPGVICASFNAG